MISKDLKVSEEAIDEIKNMFNVTISALEMSIDCFRSYNRDKADNVRKVEESIDNLEKKLRSSHIKRLNKGICSATVGTVFLDLISNLERIGDHSLNIAEIIAEN